MENEETKVEGTEETTAPESEANVEAPAETAEGAPEGDAPEATDAPAEESAPEGEATAEDKDAEIREAIANGASDEDVMSSYGIDEAKLAELKA